MDRLFSLADVRAAFYKGFDTGSGIGHGPDRWWEEYQQEIQHKHSETEPDINICPACGGPADNGFDRMLPPNPYVCTKCDNSTKASDAPYTGHPHDTRKV